ncbi:MAG: riboflavin synthase [Candidatus Competibacteraceae bacterium]|nr:riboflavin synthase [Candidatus Competibacteraceae bacterium]
MFTGIIEAVGHVIAKEPRGVDMRLHIGIGKLDLSEANLGDSIAVSGVCLTATTLTDSGFWADVSVETLERTVLGGATPGTTVNLERALTLSTRLGGHLVSGHVDGIGSVTAYHQDGRSWRLQIQAPDSLARYIAEKGSICVDGVSLTVNQVDGALFTLNIVPHTLQETTLADYRVGRRVNLEVDLIARYLERLLLGERAAQSNGRLSEQLLRERGFL